MARKMVPADEKAAEVIGARPLSRFITVAVGADGVPMVDISDFTALEAAAVLSAAVDSLDDLVPDPVIIRGSRIVGGE